MRWVYDALRLLSLITPVRVGNLFLLRYSYWASVLMNKPIFKGFPAYISVEPTTSCNLKCPQCFTMDKKFTRPKGKITSEVFETIIHQASPYAFYLNLYFQGEPFLYPGITSLVKLAKKAGFYVAVSTNAHFFTDETIQKILDSKLDRLIVSLDGIDEATYTTYRKNGDFSKVVAGITRISELKKSQHKTYPFVELQFLLHKKNQSQLPKVKAFGKSLGVDKVSIKTFQVINFNEADEWVPDENSRYSIGNDGEYRIKRKRRNRCWRVWSSCVFTWDGAMIPCCFDKNAVNSYGNLHAHNFRDIWNNEASRQFKKQVFTSRKNIDICCNCDE